jgi:hypothetical protein
MTPESRGFVRMSRTDELPEFVGPIELCVCGKPKMYPCDYKGRWFKNVSNDALVRMYNATRTTSAEIYWSLAHHDVVAKHSENVYVVLSPMGSEQQYSAETHRAFSNYEAMREKIIAAAEAHEPLDKYVSACTCFCVYYIAHGYCPVVHVRGMLQDNQIVIQLHDTTTTIFADGRLVSEPSTETDTIVPTRQGMYISTPFLRENDAVKIPRRT